MVQSDALSRRPDLLKDETENKDVTLLPNTLFIRLIDTGLQSEIIQSSDNSLAMEVLSALKTSSTLPFKSSLVDWCLDKGLILYKDH